MENYLGKLILIGVIIVVGVLYYGFSTGMFGNTGAEVSKNAEGVNKPTKIEFLTPTSFPITFKYDPDSGSYVGFIKFKTDVRTNTSPVGLLNIRGEVSIVNVTKVGDGWVYTVKISVPSSEIKDGEQIVLSSNLGSYGYFFVKVSNSESGSSGGSGGSGSGSSGNSSSGGLGATPFGVYYDSLVVHSNSNYPILTSLMGDRIYDINLVSAPAGGTFEVINETKNILSKTNVINKVANKLFAEHDYTPHFIALGVSYGELSASEGLIKKLSEPFTVIDYPLLNGRIVYAPNSFPIEDGDVVSSVLINVTNNSKDMELYELILAQKYIKKGGSLDISSLGVNEEEVINDNTLKDRFDVVLIEFTDKIILYKDGKKTNVYTVSQVGKAVSDFISELTNGDKALIIGVEYDGGLDINANNVTLLIDLSRINDVTIHSNPGVLTLVVRSSIINHLNAHDLDSSTIIALGSSIGSLSATDLVDSSVLIVGDACNIEASNIINSSISAQTCSLEMGESDSSYINVAQISGRIANSRVVAQDVNLEDVIDSSIVVFFNLTISDNIDGSTLEFEPSLSPSSSATIVFDNSMIENSTIIVPFSLSHSDMTLAIVLNGTQFKSSAFFVNGIDYYNSTLSVIGDISAYDSSELYISVYDFNINNNISLFDSSLYLYTEASSVEVPTLYADGSNISIEASLDVDNLSASSSSVVVSGDVMASKIYCDNCFIYAQNIETNDLFVYNDSYMFVEGGGSINAPSVWLEDSVVNVPNIINADYVRIDNSTIVMSSIRNVNSVQILGSTLIMAEINFNKELNFTNSTLYDTSIYKGSSYRVNGVNSTLINVQFIGEMNLTNVSLISTHITPGDVWVNVTEFTKQTIEFTSKTYYPGRLYVYNSSSSEHATSPAGKLYSPGKYVFIFDGQFDYNGDYPIFTQVPEGSHVIVVFNNNFNISKSSLFGDIKGSRVEIILGGSSKKILFGGNEFVSGDVINSNINLFICNVSSSSWVAGLVISRKGTIKDSSINIISYSNKLPYIGTVATSTDTISNTLVGVFVRNNKKLAITGIPYYMSPLDSSIGDVGLVSAKTIDNVYLMVNLMGDFETYNSIVRAINFTNSKVYVREVGDSPSDKVEVDADAFYIRDNIENVTIRFDILGYAKYYQNGEVFSKKTTPSVSKMTYILNFNASSPNSILQISGEVLPEGIEVSKSVIDIKVMSNYTSNKFLVNGDIAKGVLNESTLKVVAKNVTVELTGKIFGSKLINSEAYVVFRNCNDIKNYGGLPEEINNSILTVVFGGNITQVNLRQSNIKNSMVTIMFENSSKGFIDYQFGSDTHLTNSTLTFVARNLPQISVYGSGKVITDNKSLYAYIFENIGRVETKLLPSISTGRAFVSFNNVSELFIYSPISATSINATILINSSNIEAVAPIISGASALNINITAKNTYALTQYGVTYGKIKQSNIFVSLETINSTSPLVYNSNISDSTIILKFDNLTSSSPIINNSDITNSNVCLDSTYVTAPNISDSNNITGSNIYVRTNSPIPTSGDYTIVEECPLEIEKVNVEEPILDISEPTVPTMYLPVLDEPPYPDLMFNAIVNITSVYGKLNVNIPLYYPDFDKVYGVDIASIGNSIKTGESIELDLSKDYLEANLSSIIDVYGYNIVLLSDGYTTKFELETINVIDKYRPAVMPLMVCQLLASETKVIGKSDSLFVPLKHSGEPVTRNGYVIIFPLGIFK